MKSFFQFKSFDSKKGLYNLVLSTQDARKLRSWKLFSDSEKLNKQKLQGKLCSLGKCTQVSVRSKGDLSSHWDMKRKSYRFKFEDHSFLSADEIDFTLANDRYFEIEYMAKRIADKFVMPQLPYTLSTLSLNNTHQTLYLKTLRYTKINMEKHLKYYSHTIKLKNIWLPHLQQSNIGTFYYGFSENKFQYNQWRNFLELYSFDPNRNTLDVKYNFNQFLECLRQRCNEPERFINMDHFAGWLAILTLFGSHHGALGDNLIFLYNKVDHKFSPIVNDVLIRPIRSELKNWINSLRASNDLVAYLLDNETFKVLFENKLKELLSIDIINMHQLLIKKYEDDFYLTNTSDYLIKKGIENRKMSLDNNILQIKEYLK